MTQNEIEPDYSPGDELLTSNPLRSSELRKRTRKTSVTLKWHFLPPLSCVSVTEVVFPYLVQDKLPVCLIFFQLFVMEMFRELGVHVREI